MQKHNPAFAAARAPPKQENYTEYKLRVPRNLVKKYNVMNLKTPRPVNVSEIKDANMVRKKKKEVYMGEEEGPAMPTHGAGSVYNYERKEEARKKRRGYISREVKQQDLPYALRLGGKKGKRYTGRKEPILEHSAYYILTQCPDGVFEAVPVEAWYNFLPDIDYNTLTSDEVEQEFSKRDRTLSLFTKKYNFGGMVEEETDVKVKQKDSHHDLIIHDDMINEDNEDDFEDEKSDEEIKTKKKPTKKQKNLFRGKKKRDNTEDSDEEEEEEFAESKEVDYMSESSSEDELIELDDEPDPEKDVKSKAKDDLNLFSDSDDEEDETELNAAGKQLKDILKKEAGEGGSSDDEEEEAEDEDIDSEFSKSAIFMQGKDGKKKKGKGGSNPGSKPGSRSATPVQGGDQSADTLSQAAKQLKEGGLKRSFSPSSSPSPSSSKKQKLGSITTGKRDSPLPDSSKTSSRSATPSDGGMIQITEEAIRRYLMHKPMTTTDLMRKFKLKKTGLSKEQTVSAIASILKKIRPDQEKIDGKLYLSIKTKK